MFHPVNCSSSGSLIIFNFPCTETKVKSAKSFVNLIFEIGFAPISFLNELTIWEIVNFCFFIHDMPGQLSEKSRHLVTAVTPAVTKKKWRPEDSVSPAKK